MKVDWKRICIAYMIAVIGLGLMLTPIALAAGAAGSSSSSGHGGSSGGASGHGGDRQSGDISGGDVGTYAGYWPGGPAGSVAAWNDKFPHHRGWIGGSQNPWVYGGSNNMRSFGRGSISAMTWPATYYSSGDYWRHGR